MKNRVLLVLLAMVMAVSLVAFAACAKEEEAPPVVEEWQWPETLHASARGTTGLPKYVSFFSVMEADTGMTIRVVPEASPANQFTLMKRGDMFCSEGQRDGLTSVIEAREDYASLEGGPWPVRVLWIEDVANSGFFVRGDSKIKTLDDIGPGTKFAVWDMRASTLHFPRALLKWVQLDEEDMVWADYGTTAACVRAITDGRADIMFYFPIRLFEAAATPHGIRFIDLNPNEDPEGAKRFLADIPGTPFGPIAVDVEGARGHWGTVGHKLMVTREESDPELVYHFAKWLDENYDKYKDNYASNVYMTIDTLMEALETTFVPVHEGLIKYLKEKALWTEAHDRRQQVNVALLNTYIEAYQDAIDLAQQKEIKVDPTNKDWHAFWEDYKIEHKIPRVLMHPSLTEDAPLQFYAKESAPTVTTKFTTNITTDSATLNGTLDYMGTARAVDVSFEWGTESGALDQETTVETMATTGDFSFDLTGLTPETTYYYRIKAVGDETVYSVEMSFTTESTAVAELSVEFVAVNTTGWAESEIEVIFKTAPGATCKIVMTSSSGSVSGFPEDNVKTADSEGIVSWEWTIHRHTPSGEAKIEVFVTLGDETGKATYYFTVINPGR